MNIPLKNRYLQAQVLPRFLIICKIIAVLSLIMLVSSAVPSAAAEKFEEYRTPELERVEELMARGEFTQASNALYEFRRQNPDNPLALLYLAKLQQDFNKISALLKEVEILGNVDIASEALFMRGEFHFAADNYSEAADEYDKIITYFTTGQAYPKALLRLGMIHLVNGKMDEARAHFKLATESAEDDSIAMLARVGIMECEVKNGDWQKAVERARELKRDERLPRGLKPRVLQVLSEGMDNLGQPEKSEEYRIELMTTFPDSYQAYAMNHDTPVFFNPPALPDDESGEEVEEEGTEPQEQTVSEDTVPDWAVYTVQAGAFSERDRAMAMLVSLRGEGYNPRIMRSQKEGRTIYRVHVNFCRTKTEAEQIGKRVSEFTGMNAITLKLE